MSLDLTPDLMRSLLESLPNAVYIVDLDRRIVLWNAGAEKITGHLRQEVLGRICNDDLLMHCDENNQLVCGLRCPLLGTMRDGRERECRVTLLHKSGHRVPVRVRAVALRDDRGVILGAIELFEEMHPGTCAKLLELSAAAESEPAPQATVADVLDPRASNETAVLMIEVQDLEQLIATHGTRASAAVLDAVSQTISRNLHPSDRLGRFPDGRLIAILPGVAPPLAERIAARLHQVVGLTSVPWWGDRLSVAVTVETALARSGEVRLPGARDEEFPDLAFELDPIE